MKQIRKPFNIVMALILLIVVTIATIAFSSWLITDEITEKPIYQPGTVAKYYLDNKFNVYNGTGQAPTSPLFAEDELSYQYRKSGDTDYISGKPTNAGIYDIRVTIKENNENSVDERLKELSPKMKENLTELFLKTIDGVKK